MRDPGRISAAQFGAIVFAQMLGAGVVWLPGPLAALAGQDAWLAVLVGGGMGFLVLGILLALLGLSPGSGPFAIYEQVWGPWFGRFAGALTAGYILLLNGVILFALGQFLTSTLLPETPDIVLVALMLLVILASERNGTEIKARWAGLVWPIALVTALVILALLLPQADPDRLQPVLENGWAPLIRGGTLFLSVTFAEVIVSLQYVAAVRDREKVARYLVLGTQGPMLLYALLTGFGVMILGPRLLAILNYPVHTLAQMVRVGDFLERLEILVSAVWLLLIGSQLGAGFYSASSGLAQMLRLSEFTSLLPPVVALSTALGYSMFEDQLSYQTFNLQVWPGFALTLGVLLPALTVFFGWGKRLVSASGQDRQRRSNGLEGSRSKG